MQLVKTERDTLLRPLQTVSGIVERRHTLPILANLLITKNGPDVSFLSTDLECVVQQAMRVADRTAFFSLDDNRTGTLIEYENTDKLFSRPSDKRTEAYITGQFG